MAAASSFFTWSITDFILATRAQAFLGQALPVFLEPGLGLRHEFFGGFAILHRPLVASLE